VNATVGAIGYTVIDQILNPSNKASWSNLTLATINGVAPSNLAAATGEYDDWFEATFVPNASTPAGASLDLSNFLQTDLPQLARAPQTPAILAIPTIGGNVGTVPLTSNGGAGTKEIYINPFQRSGSCNVPAATN